MSCGKISSKAISSALLVLASLGIAHAEQVEGIYACSGYFSGYPSNYQNNELKMTFKVTKEYAYLDGDYTLFGTNIKNPFYGMQYLNCGMQFPPEFRAYNETCNKDMKIIAQDFAFLNMATMRLDALNIANDSLAHLDCVKTQY